METGNGNEMETEMERKWKQKRSNHWSNTNCCMTDFMRMSFAFTLVPFFVIT